MLGNVLGLANDSKHLPRVEACPGGACHSLATATGNVAVVVI